AGCGHGLRRLNRDSIGNAIGHLRAPPSRWTPGRTYPWDRRDVRLLPPPVQRSRSALRLLLR
ncbi:MAG: hypothetical protein M3O70_25175, partial [Actinomycetota bacterium]|nr:hypothetical protein [Actinomycetota bacterium]